jgi:hypothetical protein
LRLPIRIRDAFTDKRANSAQKWSVPAKIFLTDLAKVNNLLAAAGKFPSTKPENDKQFNL